MYYHHSNFNTTKRFLWKSLICVMCAVFLWSFQLNAQIPYSSYDRLLLSYSDWALVDAIDEMNHRKAAVAYNISNASTPGFKPIRFQDEIDAARQLYGDESMLNQVQVDDEMLKATQVRLKHSAYIRLLSTKMQITKRVVTLNKGG